MKASNLERLLFCRKPVMLVSLVRNCLFAWIATLIATLIASCAAFAQTAKTSPDEIPLFQPSKYPEGDWAPKDLVFQDVYFRASDGTQLHGWYCPCDEPRGVVLVAHGNAGHIAWRAPWLRLLQSHSRLTVFMFDYRGYGRSEGKPSVAGALMDAAAARAELSKLAHVKDSEMFLMGESLGGAVVVQLAADSAPRGLILQSTFSSYKEVAEVHQKNLAWLVPNNKLNSVSQIAKYQGPLLQSHGSADQVVPIGLGKKLFDAANEPKSFLRLENKGHNDWLDESYVKKMNEFLEKYR